MSTQTSKDIHDRLDHPVIDADGHYVEFGPDILEYLKNVAGQRVADAFRAPNVRIGNSIRMTPAERRDKGIPQEGFWVIPARNTRDRATALLPRLLYERLDEFGIDFTVLYPSCGLIILPIEDEELRRATCRAFNTYLADHFREFRDRITPAAVIPMYTPDEAIAELDYAVKTLGLKVVMMGHPVRRPIASVQRALPDAARWARWVDAFGIDSPYDYDPVWKKCLELGVSPSFHSGSRSFGFRGSFSNFTYNHIGHFAAALEAICKSLFLGGVTRRFPDLKVGFLEGGVAWACMLYSDLIGHWKKRNREALEEVNPANIDRAMFRDLLVRYGGTELAARYDADDAPLEAFHTPTPPSQEIDDFARCGISRASDIGELFTRNFYFGCEADDPLNAWAYATKVNPFKARLKTLMGSDIGHFDVVKMADVLKEAYEPVEEGLMTHDDLRDFLFTNPVRFFSEANRDFFKGTLVESAAKRLPATSSHLSRAGEFG